MAQHWFYSFGTYPSVESFAHSRAHFGLSGGRLGERLVDRLQLLEAHDPRSAVVLQPHPHSVQNIHNLWGQLTKACTCGR
jgi:hypothetical protein